MVHDDYDYNTHPHHLTFPHGNCISQYFAQCVKVSSFLNLITPTLPSTFSPIIVMPVANWEKNNLCKL